jgi:hypothetical protein
MTKIELMHQINLTDKEGNIIEQYEQEVSKSFCIAFLKHIEKFSQPSRLVNVTDTTNIAREITTSMRIDGQSEIATPGPLDPLPHELGIVIGTGTAAHTLTDHKLATIIPHGLGTGQMFYFQCMFAGATADQAHTPPKIDFKIDRLMVNQTTSNIIVSEIGIYTRQQVGTTMHSFLICRDVLPTAITVTPDNGIHVHYIYRTTA